MLYSLLELLVWQRKSETWQRLVSAKRKREPRPQVQVIFVGATSGLFKEIV